MSRNRDKIRPIESNNLSCSSTHSLMVDSMLCTVRANSVTLLNTLSSSRSRFRSFDMMTDKERRLRNGMMGARVAADGSYLQLLDVHGPKRSVVRARTKNIIKRH
uniref:Uncharacterized protein n=1 Tax=Schizaphis graminum TaxID=13262 RepID=A0A2S2PA07_SCHGA